TPAPTTPAPTTPAPTTPAPTTPAPTGRTFYVAPTGQDGNAGSENAPYRTIQYAAGRAQPGDTIIVRAGTYYEKITPNSGTATAPVTIKGYPGERPLIDGDNRVYRNIEVIGKSYIVFENLRVEEPLDAWAHIENSDHITLQNIEFMNPTYPSGIQRNFNGVALRFSSYNKILNSRFDRWGRYQGGDQEGNHIGITGDMNRGGYNLIEGNYFTYGAQGSIIVNAPYNIIRNNTFDNDWQKGIYLGYFVNPGDAPAGTIYPAYRNLVEGNTFLRSNNSEAQHGGLGYEETAVATIFRRNVIRNSDHVGLIVTVFGNYAPMDYGNHIFHNTIVNNGLDRFEWMGTGISITNHGLGTELHDDIVKNNIIYGNLAGAGNNPFQLTIEVSGSSNRPPFAGMIVAGNLIENPRASTCQQNLNAGGNGNGECPIYVAGVGDANADWFNTRYPQNFWGNKEGNPNFVAYNPSANQFDLHLQSTSPAIDAGVSLTETVSTGSGTVIQVKDAGYFHAGYNGMIAADSIRVGSETVTIVSINYDTNTITVNRSISWSANTPVNLPFNGNGPDIGAFER
ncbi:MAG: DUF1565 domain-containing protein, partial [Chloroflexi bacterium]|nr:DUF1565 domain-containing protein [Chloroflexota bacterium]NOG63491.1 DUF1565 domain-containing protein [Chloroflexota bacterium]